MLFEQAGAIQAIHFSGLVASAAEHDCLMVLGDTAGDFVAAGDVFVEIKTRAEANPFCHPTRSSCADWLLRGSNVRLSRIPPSHCALSPTSESKHDLRP